MSNVCGIFIKSSRKPAYILSLIIFKLANDINGLVILIANGSFSVGVWEFLLISL